MREESRRKMTVEKNEYSSMSAELSYRMEMRKEEFFKRAFSEIFRESEYARQMGYLED